MRDELHDPTPVTLEAALRRTIRDVADFPRAGIVYKDITPVLLDHALFAHVIEAMAAPFRADQISHVLAVESRGFIFGAPMALTLGAALVPARKPKKLPYLRVTEEYDLEYGKDALEVHRDAFGEGARVLVVDDVLATGGTARAACRLAGRLRARIEGVAVLADLSFLPWREALVGYRVHSLVSF